MNTYYIPGLVLVKVLSNPTAKTETVSSVTEACKDAVVAQRSTLIQFETVLN